MTSYITAARSAHTPRLLRDLAARMAHALADAVEQHPADGNLRRLHDDAVSVLDELIEVTGGGAVPDGVADRAVRVATQLDTIALRALGPQITAVASAGLLAALIAIVVTPWRSPALWVMCALVGVAAALAVRAVILRSQIDRPA